MAFTEGSYPSLAELKVVLGITTDVKDDVLEPALLAAIEAVESDTAVYEDGDVPARLHQAALLLAVMVTKAPEAPFGVAAVFDVGGMYVARTHPSYTRLITGLRSSFGIA